MQRRDFLRGTTCLAMTTLAGRGHAQVVPGRIRIGQVGTKHAHASGKLAAIRKLDDIFELVGVVEPDSEQRRQMSEKPEYADVHWLSEENLLGTSGLQAVAVESEVAELVPTATRALRAGMHVHLDKPAGDSLPAFERLMELAEAQQRIVQMGYMLRYNPAFQLMYRAVAEGWLGRIMEVDAMMGKLASEAVRQKIARFPGGGMFELGGHLIDSIVFMLGAPQDVIAFSHRTQVDGVADNQLAVLNYEHATATVRCNHRDPFGFPRRRFQISGDQGTIEIKPLESGNLTLMLNAPQAEFDKGIHQLKLTSSGGRYDQEFIDLARVIREEKKFAWSKQHDLDTHATLLQASGQTTG